MKKVSHHVVPALNGGWNVRKGGSVRAMKHFKTQTEAEEWARQIAIQRKSDLVIHFRDGTIKTKYSFGLEPLLPNDHR